MIINNNEIRAAAVDDRVRVPPLARNPPGFFFYQFFKNHVKSCKNHANIISKSRRNHNQTMPKSFQNQIESCQHHTKIIPNHAKSFQNHAKIIRKSCFWQAGCIHPRAVPGPAASCLASTMSLLWVYHEFFTYKLEHQALSADLPVCVTMKCLK